ncbi:MAG: SurA N-terminal domain-containing protein [Candidatus Accumulibacter sp.]|jgi:peptidyl-prolyl cis-trans isomerase D|nr:SurA N-terminal domain-containing protein [Accumulibacter sp.]
MFDVLHSDKKIVKFLLPLFLALIALPFIFTGVMDPGTPGIGKGANMAKVGGAKISDLQFDLALRNEQNRMRNRLGDAFKPGMVNDPFFRQEVLNDLIERQLLFQEIDRRKLWLSADVVRSAIAAMPDFQENGKFSKARYDWFLQSTGLQAETSIREDLMIRQYLDAIDSAFVSNMQAEALLRLQLEERQFHEIRIPAERFFESIAVGEDDVRKYYDANKPSFEEPEKIKVEYVVLSQDDIFSRIIPSESETKVWYDDHQDRYRQEEERQARHILIKAENAEEKVKAKSKAGQILAEVKKAPMKFGELAKRYSQDVGTAPNGGDLGFFQRGAMVKPFADAVFETLKKEEISGLVESDYGYHIIQLMDIRPERRRLFDEVRGEIEDEIRRQTAARKFAESAESFSNAVYEQSDDLQSVAGNFNLKLQKTDWFPRDREKLEALGLGILANDGVFERIFSKDAIKTKQNTETVEIGQNAFIAARVVDYDPAKLKPLEAVKADIEKRLRLREAMNLARKAGEHALEKLGKGSENGEDAALKWSPVRTIVRNKVPPNFPQAMVKAIFGADSGKIPAYSGLVDGEGYTIFKVVKVNAPEKTDEQDVRNILREYNAIVAQQELSAFMTNLRKRYPIEINQSRLVVTDD